MLPTGTITVRMPARLADLVAGLRDHPQPGFPDRGGSQRLAWHVKTTGRNEDISLDVTVNGQATPKDQGPQLQVGSTAQLRYVVTNLGTWTSFYDITIVDPRVPMSAMSCTNTREVYLGSVVCTASLPVTEGRYSQVIVANAFSANTPRMQATAWMDWTGVP